ncbi:unnamed protein product [Gongylonema pulchrum]|uniref:Uncharacterized protein n=1 Tax=Gongylonema pulchrum TaxID=637853 RepID=A0A3P7P9V2_9BILA|nr:unnamed protein product [Gongylonema pulchrum]
MNDNSNDDEKKEISSSSDGVKEGTSAGPIVKKEQETEEVKEIKAEDGGTIAVHASAESIDKNEDKSEAKSCKEDQIVMPKTETNVKPPSANNESMSAVAKETEAALTFDYGEFFVIR